MKKERPFPHLILFVGIAIVAMLLGVYARRRAQQTPPRPTPTAMAPAKQEPAAEALPDPNDQSPEAILNRFLYKLRHGPMGPDDLAAFRAAMLAADPGQAVAAIRKFLSTGQDSLTGEHFTVTQEGALAGAPTYRILLLDLLGRIAKANGMTDAGEVSRALMEKKSTADEWAIALRNVAWDTPNDHAYLSSKVREMLNDPAWRQQHSPGFYEAFDVIVYTHDVSFIPQLSEFVRSEDEPLKNTAATTLDRLSGMAPLEVMSYLNTHPAELAEKPYLRADFYTKADFTQAGQRAAVEAYLDRADVQPKAKEKVIAALGAPNIFVSDNLLTSTATPGDETQPLIPPAQKAALSKAFNDWLTTNRYPGLSLSIMTRQLDLQQ